MPPLSVLDLSTIVQGSDAASALHNSRDLAQHAERLGYRRFWLAEHHNMPGVASAATAVVIGHVAAGTRTIRVGAGGIMLPNHAPLTIAEQFGTLESLFPGRIDLALGRAPGSDAITQRALRRDAGSADQFPQDVLELQAWFREAEPGQRVRAVPGAGLRVPLYILGSSLFGAQLAASLGLPYAFASHFAPAALEQAITIYRSHFRPSEQLERPYLMLGLPVLAAETDREAKHLQSSISQAILQLRRGRPMQLPPPDATFEERLSPEDRALLGDFQACAVVGSPDSVRKGLAAFAERHRPDELVVTAQVFDHAARVRSLEITAEVAGLRG
ncbi:MAG: LLM class flavin-dependent oxidoreductase [Polyangiales bacterium]